MEDIGEYVMNFLSGSYFKSQCHWQFTDYVDARNCQFTSKEDFNIDNDYVFCKTEYLQTLAQYVSNHVIRLPHQFKLFTHNSDINIDAKVIDVVLNWFPNMGHWYTQNLLVQHDKVSPIPIGLANPKWSHGNVDRFKKIIEETHEKSNTVYVNFNISTNPKERIYCLQQIQHDVSTKYPNAASIAAHDEFVNTTQEEYLRDIKKSYFVVSPDGNGKDCHKTWESIYMGSIPIVTDSYFARRFKELGIPIYIIDDWSQFKNLHLTSELYKTIWNNFDINHLNIKLFL